MGYHAGVSWLPGGLLGVDVFFVLSGFLITSLLLTEYNRTGRVDLLRFWGRRAKRLLPAMAILLASMIAWAAFVATPADPRLAEGRRIFLTALRRELALHLLGAGLLRSLRAAIAAAAHLVGLGGGAVLPGLAAAHAAGAALATERRLHACRRRSGARPPS